MARQQSMIPISNTDDQSSWIEEQLVVICHNLLARPLDRRGPFVIPDRELKDARNKKTLRPLRLAAAT
jgi:hypothetical protein